MIMTEDECLALIYTVCGLASNDHFFGGFHNRRFPTMSVRFSTFNSEGKAPNNRAVSVY